MDNAKHIGRVGALAVALGVGNVRRTATRMTVSIGAAALVVMATVVPVSTASASTSDLDVYAVYGHPRDVRLDPGLYQRSRRPTPPTSTLS